MSMSQILKIQEQIGIERGFRAKVFHLTAIALGVCALGVWSAGYVFQFMPSLWPLIIAELALVFTASWWSQLERPTNILLYGLFAFMSGLTLAPLISVAIATGGAALLFKALIATVCLSTAAGTYALTTDRDLSGLGGFLMMGLIGLIVVGVLQIFWPSNTVELYSSLFGVGLFSVFIAYKIQIIDRFPKNRAIEASLSLFLSIVNLFIDVLRLLMALNRR